MALMDRDDEFAEFDTTEAEFDAMWAEGEPAGFEMPELVVVHPALAFAEGAATLTPNVAGLLHLDVHQGEVLAIAGSSL